MDEQFTGLILAGGRSRRFGSDKAEHAIDDLRMIDRVTEAVRPLVGEVLISVQVEGDAPGDVDGRVVTDRFRDRGPLGGLHSGLLASRSPWILVAPCDMPYLTTTVLQQLTRRCTEDAPAVLAVGSDGRRHPLCGCYHRSIVPIIERRLFAADYSVHGLIDAVSSVEVVLPDEVLINVNRPSDISR